MRTYSYNRLTKKFEGNKIAVQIFTKKGPLAFFTNLYIDKTSVVYSIDHKVQKEYKKI